MIGSSHPHHAYPVLRVLSFGEMMEVDGCSYRIKYTEAVKLADRGHHIVFVTPRQERKLFATKGPNDTRMQVLFSPGWAPTALRRGGFSLADMLYKLWLVMVLDFDVLRVTCGHRPAQLIPALAARFLRHRPIIDEWWEWYGRGGRAETRSGLVGFLIARYDLLFEIKAKAWFSAVIAISSKLKERLESNHHVTILNGGVEVDHLSPGDKQEARSQLGLSDNLFLVGLSSVGRADHPDLLPFLLTFRQLAEKNSRLHLFVSGEYEYVQNQFLNQPGGEQVLYNGWLEMKMYSLYMRACDIFVLPISDVPRNAGRWPNKIGDFLYFERPIVSNPTGDIPDLFSNKRLGMLCANEPKAYYDILKSLLESNNQQLKHMCADSWKTAIDLSTNKRLDILEDIYKTTKI